MILIRFPWTAKKMNVLGRRIDLLELFRIAFTQAWKEHHVKRVPFWKLRTPHIFPNRCEEWLLCINDCWKIILCKTWLNKQLRLPLYSFPISRTTTTHHRGADIVCLLGNKHLMEKIHNFQPRTFSYPVSWRVKLLRENWY